MAGLGRKVFTAGDVLTASDVQNYLMDQSVMVFAGTAARSSAIATPTDGMVTYNQTNNSLEAYNGSEWINKSGLQLVKTQTIGSGVSSVTVTNAFSAIYDNYKIFVSGGVGSTTTSCVLTFGSTSTGYYSAGLYVVYSGATVTGFNSSNSSSFPNAVNVTTGTLSGEITVQQPNLAKFTTVDINAVETITGGAALIRKGWLNNTDQYTAFTLTPASGTITGGTISVYGYAK